MRDRIAKIIADQAGFSHEGSRQYEAADAVLKAMMMPTDAMLAKVAFDPILKDAAGTYANYIYQTMIAAALK